ncbi:MAG: PQQ-like beta-propeller repeat protein [Pirellulales bacterium]|nr:PQQ-like beta-propeller repeat protein [Pirellulales bacterium]
MVKLRITVIVLVVSLLSAGPTMSQEQAQTTSRFFGGLCVVIGDVDSAITKRYGASNYVVNILSKDLDSLSAARKISATLREHGATCHASLWSGKTLPYVDNLANVIVVESSSKVPESELMRVLRPGGMVIRGSDKKGVIHKPEPSGTDQWTHPWHGADGGLVTDDQTLGVPTGIQWIHGPQFPMAGRKTSTQSVVSAGGRHFTITQNVLDNIGKIETARNENMPHYLVARDAYNGLVLWQRPWKGPIQKLAGELNPLIVASSDRLFVGSFEGIEILNAADGVPIERIAVTEPATELILQDKSLLVQSESTLACHILSETGSTKAWELTGGSIGETVVDGELVYTFLQKNDSEHGPSGELVCVNLRDGKIKWREGANVWPKAERDVRICFANDGYVAVLDRSMEFAVARDRRRGKVPPSSRGHALLHMFRGKDGEHLWSQTTNAKTGKHYADIRYAGHFYLQGLVWMQLESTPYKSDGQATWAAFDPETGSEQRRLTTSGLWPRSKSPGKLGCQLMIASNRFIMVPRLATFIDFESGSKIPVKFMRGVCGSGFIPANGLLYSSPHACACYGEVVRGFIASHSRPIPDASILKNKDRLSSYLADPVSTPASGKITSQDWPMHRYDTSRSAASPTIVPETLATRWKVSVGRPLNATTDGPWRIRSGMPISAPVIAGDTVFVCDVQNHRVLAIDDANGEVRWEFTADGRIDSPPTISEGRCLFGSHDGYVYCLRAKDGALLWRYLVAPADRRIVVFGQVESAWPVAGAVLVRDQVAYAAAGRSPDADGGITVVGLDIKTGNPLWSAKSRAEMVGVCDYLVAEGDQVFLSNLGFDAKTGKCTPSNSPSHFRGGIAGLLEASWFDDDLALRKKIHTWTARGAEGQLLAMSAGDTFGYREAERAYIQNVLQRKGESALFGIGSQEWSVEVKAPRQVRALVVAGHHLLSASASAPHSPAEGGILSLRRTADGVAVTEVAIPAPPVFDGMAVANKRVYIALANGTLISMGSPD